MKTSGGVNWGEPNLDWVGLLYLSLAIVTTGFVTLGLGLLYTKRKTFAVRIRGFSLLCVTVLLLYGYLMLVLLVYPLNGLFKCDLEFFVMSIFLPLGIAVFQACNMRLLSYYQEQQILAEVGYIDEKKRNTKKKSLLSRWKRQTALDKTVTTITVGICVQILLTLFLYFASRNFHGSYGIFSTYNGPGRCRRGPEWIPSVVWQFLWSTVFGPYVLLKTRHIKDTHYWAFQTRLSVFACFPGTPLWLIFLYSDHPTLTKVNRWFVPAGWFLPGLYAMIFISIYFPLFDAHKEEKFRRSCRKSFEKASLLSSGPTTPGALSPGALSQNRSLESLSMAALERQLSKNIEPLLHWAAQKEFTAENIVFLRAVRDFKKKWGLVAKRSPLDESQQRDRYEEAALIYFTLVNPVTAKFNINIDHATYEDLAQLFSGLKYEPFDSDSSSTTSSNSGNIIAPWTSCEENASSLQSPMYEDPPTVSDVDKLYPLPVTEIRPVEVSKETVSQSKVKIVGGVQIPAIFSLDIFDKSYDSVKQDVFFNTWMRFEARNKELQYL